MGNNTSSAMSFEDMAEEQENAEVTATNQAGDTATEPVTTEAGDKCDCVDCECTTDEASCTDESCDCNETSNT